jgi:hypothetical protein
LALLISRTKTLLERVQVQFGRRLLKLQQSIPGTYVRRELGLQSLEERAYAATLNFFGKLCTMDKERLASKLFHKRAMIVDDTDHGRYSWCVEAKRVLRECGLGAAWYAREIDPEEWRLTAKRAVRTLFLEKDDRRTQQRPQLALFHRLGPCTQRDWLDRPLNHSGAALRFRLRCGGAPLMETVGAKVGRTGCPMCERKDVTESAEHFACHCTFFDEERDECLHRLEALAGGLNVPVLKQAIASKDVALFLGDSKLRELSSELRQKVDIVLCNYLKVAWKKRLPVWQGLCDGNDWRLR